MHYILYNVCIFIILKNFDKYSSWSVFVLYDHLLDCNYLAYKTQRMFQSSYIQCMLYFLWTEKLNFQPAFKFCNFECNCNNVFQNFSKFLYSSSILWFLEIMAARFASGLCRRLVAQSSPANLSTRSLVTKCVQGRFSLLAGCRSSALSCVQRFSMSSMPENLKLPTF